eukprot:TRINITY_DN966_c4_g1_i1.p2 TRINITY_DN966_c4_g1~~TRINITY_DN966_c4_g1_i1.p2  ORF type:complete len:354 (-),score=86.95 TRINITY_DN966_c4_g1_i1:110-1129(-)
MEPKSELAQVVQRLTRKCLNKNDVQYKCERYGNQFQAIVTLNCMGGTQYAGHLAPDIKQAEKSAALQALEANRAAFEAAPPPINNKKRPMKTPEDIAAKKARQQELGVNPLDGLETPKLQLNALYMKIVKKCNKGDIAYTTQKVLGGFQSTVMLIGLPGDWAQRKWAGQVSNTRQNAEHKAAEQALAMISADPELTELANKKREGGAKGMGKGGKGGGKAAWGNPFEDMMWAAMSLLGGGGGGGGGGSWGGGYKKKDDGPRTRVLPEPILGEVTAWKGPYGFVKPSVEIDHPGAKKHEGNLYVSVSDIGELEQLEPGQKVKFYVYDDGKGIGGEEVTLA